MSRLDLAPLVLSSRRLKPLAYLVRAVVLSLPAMLVLGLLSLTLPIRVEAQEIHWNGNAGNGLFFDGNNWSPVGAPENFDIIRIGNLPGTAGANVMMAGAAGIVYELAFDHNGKYFASCSLDKSLRKFERGRKLSQE